MRRLNPPPKTYEGLLKHCNSLRMLIHSLEAELKYYRKRDYSLSEPKIAELEAKLESEKAMNEILTKELTNDR